MPLHLTHLRRRDFLLAGTAGAAGLVMAPLARADAAVEANRVVLLSDTHIPDSPDVSARGVNMTDNLRQVVASIVGQSQQPAGVIINGDCAYLKGLPADYANFATCVAPLVDAAIPLHLTMGNHDDRGPLYDALSSQRPETPLVDSKHVSVLQMPHANFFLLDSLHQVNVVTGMLGDEQLAWLAESLTRMSDKPAVLISHHHPQFEPPAEGRPWGGIMDTDRLMGVVGQHRHVKAMIFGHTHNWSLRRHGDLQLINLPPVAYVFNDSHPNGWVDAQVRPDGLDLTLHTLQPDDERNGSTVSVDWA